jgi:hypothetical protein
MYTVVLCKVLIIFEILNTLAALDKNFLSTSFFPHPYMTKELTGAYVGRLRDMAYSVVPGLVTRGIRGRRHSRSFVTRGCSPKY